MKILLIFNNEEKTLAGRVRLKLKRKGILVDEFPVKPLDGGAEDIKSAFDVLPGSFSSIKGDESGADVPVCALVVSALPRRWFDFFAGFSRGSHSPFLVYGEKAIAVMPAEFPFFIPLATESALEEYLRAENEAFERLEAARESLRARETLLSSGVSLTEESLVQCVREGSETEILLFLAAGFSPNTRDKAGVPLLNIAARKGNREMLRLLLQNGADLALTADDRGTSALIDSSIGKYSGLAVDLIEAGADVNGKSKEEQSALTVAVGAGDEEMAEILLKAGADADVPDVLGVTARKYAALFHQESMMKLFETYPEKTAV